MMIQNLILHIMELTGYKVDRLQLIVISIMHHSNYIQDWIILSKISWFCHLIDEFIQRDDLKDVKMTQLY